MLPRNRSLLFQPRFGAASRVSKTARGTHPSIFSVAKFETKNASPNFADVVFAFANIDRDNNSIQMVMKITTA